MELRGILLLILITQRHGIHARIPILSILKLGTKRESGLGPAVCLGSRPATLAGSSRVSPLHCVTSSNILKVIVEGRTWIFSWIQHREVNFCHLSMINT